MDRWVEEDPATYDLPADDSDEEESTLLLPPPAKQPEELIDMTSMVDIVFFLLVFFLVTSIHAIESVMDMPPPKAPSGATGRVGALVDYANDADFIRVKIEDDDSIWVEDTQTFNEADLRIRLHNARDEMTNAAGVLVLGSADASHGAAVSVFDACADAKLGNVLFAVQDSEQGE